MKPGVLTKTIVLFLCTACHPKTDNLPQLNDLRMAICNSIEVPFTEADTLIYESFSGMCGNSSQEELDRYFEPNLSQSPFIQAMQKQFKGKLLFSGDSLNELMKSQCRNDSISLWDCFSKNKVYLSITGQTESNRSIRIYEIYRFNEQEKRIVKLFSFENKQWHYSLLK